MKHTPEPWEVGASRTSVVYANGQKSKVIARMTTNEMIVRNAFEVDEPEANAARIVACVNAMKGKEDPEHFIKMGENYIQQDKDIRDAINAHPEESTFDEVVRLKSQHAQLLEALQFCQSVIKSQGMFDLSERMAYDKAEAAIQKATPKKS